MAEKIRIVHVDDQEQERQAVKKILGDYKNLELVAQFGCATEARDFILENAVDLALLDVEMPVHNGLWLAEAIRGSGVEIAFLTAHPDYSLMAFEACAIHYILKPITKKLIGDLILRYEHINGTDNSGTEIQGQKITELIHNYFEQTSYPKRVFIHNVHKTTVLNLDEVLYITSAGQYTSFKLKDGLKYTASKTLKVYEIALQHHPDFIRVHRKNLVNKKFIKNILQEKHIVTLMMADGVVLQVSPQKKDEIYDLIMK